MVSNLLTEKSSFTRLTELKMDQSSEYFAPNSIIAKMPLVPNPVTVLAKRQVIQLFWK